MNGSDTAGLEPADAGQPGNNPGRNVVGSFLLEEAAQEGRTKWEKRVLTEAARILIGEAIWPSQEGQSRSEGAHGEAAQARGEGTEVIACTTHKMIVFRYDGRLSCGCSNASEVMIDLGRKPSWLIEGRATGSGAGA